MTRWCVAMPILVMTGLPIWTAPCPLAAPIEGLAAILCAIGVLRDALGPVTAGASIAVIGYAVGLWSTGAEVNLVAAGIFGLALLFLFDLSEFARRLRGAKIIGAVMRQQIAYWFGRAALASGAAALLILCGSALARIIDSETGALAAGLGAVIAFAGAIYAAGVRSGKEGA
jgi:hypothetical protein